MGEPVLVVKSRWRFLKHSEIYPAGDFLGRSAMQRGGTFCENPPPPCRKRHQLCIVEHNLLVDATNIQLDDLIDSLLDRQLIVCLTQRLGR